LVFDCDKLLTAHCSSSSSSSSDTRDNFAANINNLLAIYKPL